MLNASQKIFSRNIAFLFNNKKQKRSTYLNNCNLSTINIVQRVFNFNFNILRDIRRRKRERETRQKTILLFALQNL